MKQKTVGIYYGGCTEIELVARSGTGGEFYSCPETGKLPRIKVGMGYKEWWQVMDVLLHEIMEWTMSESRLRFQRADTLSRSASDYWFWVQHEDLAECCARSARFLSECLPDLAATWKRWNRKPKRRRKK